MTLCRHLLANSLKAPFIDLANWNKRLSLTPLSPTRVHLHQHGRHCLQITPRVVGPCIDCGGCCAPVGPATSLARPRRLLLRPPQLTSHPTLVVMRSGSSVTSHCAAASSRSPSASRCHLLSYSLPWKRFGRSLSFDALGDPTEALLMLHRLYAVTSSAVP